MIVELVALGGGTAFVAMITDVFYDTLLALVFFKRKNADTGSGPGTWQATGGGFERLWCRRCEHVIARRRDDGHDYGHQQDGCDPRDADPDDRDLHPAGPRLTVEDFPHLRRIAEREEFLEQLADNVPGLTADDLAELGALLDMPDVGNLPAR